MESIEFNGITSITDIVIYKHLDEVTVEKKIHTYWYGTYTKDKMMMKIIMIRDRRERNIICNDLGTVLYVR